MYGRLRGAFVVYLEQPELVEELQRRRQLNGVGCTECCLSGRVVGEDGEVLICEH